MGDSSHSKQIAKGAFWTLAGAGSIKFISFIYVIILARFAPPSIVGTFYLALGILGIFEIFADLGLRSSLSRYVPFFIGKDEKIKLAMLIKIIYTAVIIVSCCVTIFVFFASDLVAGYFGDNTADLAIALKLLAPYLIVSMLLSTNTTLLSALKDIRRANLFYVFQNFIKLLATVLLFFFLGVTIFSITVGFLISFIFAAIISIFYAIPHIKKFLGYSDNSKISFVPFFVEIFSFGLMLTLVSSLSVLISNIDRIMIGYFIGGEAVAVYTIAATFATIVMIIPSSFTAMFFPLVTELLGKEKKPEARSICNTSVRWSVFAGIPLAIVLIIFSSSLLRMFYGDAYAIGGNVLTLFALGLLIRSFTFVHSFVLAGLRLVKLELKIGILTLFVNLVLNWFLIPLWGIEGAGVASAISLIFASLCLIYYTKKVIGFAFPVDSLKAFFAGALALVIILFLKPYIGEIITMLPDVGEGVLSEFIFKFFRLLIFGALFAIAGAIYTIVLFLLRAFNSEDVEILESAMRRAKIPNNFIELISKIFNYGVGKIHG